MTRKTTDNYNAEIDTAFAWADTDNDYFNREADLYRLAKALEKHDHSAAHGLPVARVTDGLLTSGAYAPNSIPTTAYGNLSITGPKIAAATITDDKLVNDKVNVAGDTMTADLRVTQAALGSPNTGFIYVGPTATAYLNYSPPHLVLRNGNAGGYLYLLGQLWTYNEANANLGSITFGNGHMLNWNGSKFQIDGVYDLLHTGNTGNFVSVPLWGQVCFRAASEIPPGGQWVRETDADGRILVGAGTTSGGSGISFGENQLFSTDGNAWKLTGHLTITGGGGSGGSGTTSPSDSPAFLVSPGSGGGATNVTTSTHTHPFTAPGGGSAPTLNYAQNTVYPPMKSVVWARRVS